MAFFFKLFIDLLMIPKRDFELGREYDDPLTRSHL